MWLSERLRRLVPCLLVLALAGCIHPLYGRNGVNTQLAQIEVAPIPDRLGHYLVEELKFDTDGSGNRPPPKYRLTITAKSNVSGLVVNLSQLRSDAAQVVVTATYTLTAIEGGAQITTGTATASASYDRTEQRYANVRAARDAEIRAVGLLADQIRTRLAIALLDRK
jgi:LPS-assembly lipoprotein